MMLELSIAIAGVLLFLFKTAEILYFFQIKEYRLDRFWSFVKEEGFLTILYLKHPTFPAKKPRNFLIMLGSIPSAFTYFAFLLTLSIPKQIITIALSPSISFITVLLGVITTMPVARIYRDRLIAAARNKVLTSKAVFVAISGTYGKTSTKEFLFQLLSKKWKTAKTDENMNTDVGVAISISKNLKNDTRFFVAEVGAYKRGEVAGVCDLIRPTYGILTSTGNQHIDLFGSLENLIQSEAEFLAYLPEHGKAYINKDTLVNDAILKQLKAKPVFFSMKIKRAGVYPKNIHEKGGSIQASVYYNKELFEIAVHLLGRHNIANLLPCIALCHDLGMTKKEVVDGLAGLTQVPGKLSLHKGKFRNSLILNDANNSSREGFIAAIQTADSLNIANTIIVSKGIIELGREKTQTYKKILRELFKTHIQLITTDKLFTILDTKGKTIFCRNEKEIFSKIKRLITKQTLIVLEGKFTEKFMQKIISKAFNF